MNKIGFKNFRRFQNFEPLEYRGITFLVGRNNAGKSTLVKALLIIENYFNSRSFDTISFSKNILEEANIVTFGRALNFHAKQKGEKYISFIQEMHGYLIEINVKGQDDNTYANIQTLTITQLKINLIYYFDMNSKILRVTKIRDEKIENDSKKNISTLEEQIAITKKQLVGLKFKKTSKEYIETNSRLENLHMKLANVYKSNNNSDFGKILFTLEEDFEDTKSLRDLVERLVSNSEFLYKIDFNKSQKGLHTSKEFEDLLAFKEFGPYLITTHFDSLLSSINDYSYSYIGGNLGKQSALFAIRDKNNSLTQVIHEFKQFNISKGEEIYRFVIKWMKEFEIGEDFIISMHAGEAYELKIVSNNSEIHLADKGMGTIQLMLLVLNLACVIKDIKESSDDFQKTVIIEEPELNLHPALQSKLADLFLEVYLNYKIRFIVETHSEYLIRKTQLLVKEKEFEIKPNENPFSVIYFDKDLTQWNMNYREDGKFIEDFGKGFYDESSLLTLNLL
jgi:predicted ATP-dependent endonuclease of OLD family